MVDSKDGLSAAEEDQELIRRGNLARGKRMLTELSLAICGVLIILGFGMAHLSGIQGPLHHPGVIVGVVGIGGALLGGICWAVRSPHWLVDEVLGRAAEHEFTMLSGDPSTTEQP